MSRSTRPPGMPPTGRSTAPPPRGTGAGSRPGGAPTPRLSGLTMTPRSTAPLSSQTRTSGAPGARLSGTNVTQRNVASSGYGRVPVAPPARAVPASGRTSGAATPTARLSGTNVAQRPGAASSARPTAASAARAPGSYARPTAASAARSSGTNITAGASSYARPTAASAARNVAAASRARAPGAPTPTASGSSITGRAAASSGYGRPTGPTTLSAKSSGTSTRPATPKVVSQTTSKVTVRKPTGQTTSSVKTEKTVEARTKPTASKTKLGAPVGVKRSQAAVPIPPPSVLRKQVSLQVKGAAAKAPIGTKVTAVAAKKTKVPPLEQIMTPEGPQQVIQKTITEKRVERSKQGEIVSKNVKTIKMDPQTGETIQVEQEVQKLNPDFPAPQGPIKEVVAIISEKDITESYETTVENVVRETTKLDAGGVDIDLQQVSKLVEEEKEDVQNALKMHPPELVHQSPERFPLKKKLQALTLSPENIALLEESVIQPPITADDPLPEPTPEVMAKVMDAMDKNLPPKTDPETTFNALFEDNGPFEPPSSLISVSAAVPGPVGDVVVPNEIIPDTTQEEMLSEQMEEVAIVVQTAENKPPDDSFSVQTPQKPQKSERKKWDYKALTEEDPPWDPKDMAEISVIVGAYPIENIDASDILEKTQNGEMDNEFEKGIEYILDCKPLQYCSRVQLRGTHPPAWFPGYIYALSEMSDGVEVAKTPSQVLFAAWRSVQPEIFPENSIVYN